MKTNRHSKILELIAKYPITTQEELIEHLRAQGYEVTQSTVSRDIKQLRLSKTLLSDGKYRYQASAASERGVKNNFVQIFTTSFVSCECAQNIVVIKTLSGMASAACAAIDSLDYDSIIGTLAGEDTIMAVCKDENSARVCAEDFSKYIR